jgi:excisionase family DNA binding protein
MISNSEGRTMADYSPIPLTHTIPQAVERSRCGRSKLYEAIRQGDLAVVKLGRKTLILEKDLQEWLHRHRLRREAA